MVGKLMPEEPSKEILVAAVKCQYGEATYKCVSARGALSICRPRNFQPRGESIDEQSEERLPRGNLAGT